MGQGCHVFDAFLNDGEAGALLAQIGKDLDVYQPQFADFRLSRTPAYLLS